MYCVQRALPNPVTQKLSFINFINNNYLRIVNTARVLLSYRDVTHLFQAQMRDYLCRLLFCHLLGYDAGFACIHAVKLAQQGVLIEKKTGNILDLF